MRGGVFLLKDVTEFLYGAAQFRCRDGMLRVFGSDLDKNLVFKFYLAESQFVVCRGPGEKLDDVFLQAQLQSEQEKQGHGGHDQDVHQ